MRRLLIALIVVALAAGGFGLGYIVGTRADRTEVPDVVGLGTQNGGQAAARREFAAAGLRLGRVGRKVCASDEDGLVVQQNPPAGTIVSKGSTVNVAIGDDGTHIIGIVRYRYARAVPPWRAAAGGTATLPLGPVCSRR